MHSISVNKKVFNYINERRGNLSVSEFLTYKFGIEAEQKDIWGILEKPKGTIFKIPFFNEAAKDHLMSTLEEISQKRPFVFFQQDDEIIVKL